MDDMRNLKTKGGTGRKALAGLLLLTTGISAGLTYAAFTSTRNFSDNDLSSATVLLTSDNTSAQFEFDVANMKPGDFAERCVSLTYDGSPSPDIRLYGTTTGTGLDGYIDLTVRKHNTAVVTTNGTCTNFVNGTSSIVSGPALLSAYPADYANGVTQAGWADDETRSYKIRVQLRSDAPDAASGLTSKTQYTWEAR